MERLTPDDYYREALVLLGESGPEGLTIAALCERLGVTKGSFYHHFTGMPAFVTQLLGYWEREHGARLIRISRAQPDPTLRITTLTDMGVALPHASEAAIRAWGRSNTDVAEATARVDRRRERHLIDAVCALGVDRQRGRLLARIALNLLVGVQQREHPVDLRRLRQMFEAINELVFLEADPKLVARVLEATGG